MSSEKFNKIAISVVEKNKPLFDSLVEFENTKKIRTKDRLDFTIDKSIASRFKKLCRDKGYIMSAKVENAIREILRKEEY